MLAKLARKDQPDSINTFWKNTTCGLWSRAPWQFEEFASSSSKQRNRFRSCKQCNHKWCCLSSSLIWFDVAVALTWCFFPSSCFVLGCCCFMACWSAAVAVGFAGVVSSCSQRKNYNNWKIWYVHAGRAYVLTRNQTTLKTNEPTAFRNQQKGWLSCPSFLKWRLNKRRVALAGDFVAVFWDIMLPKRKTPDV